MTHLERFKAAMERKSFDRLAGLMPARYAKEERSEDVVTSLY